MLYKIGSALILILISISTMAQKKASDKDLFSHDILELYSSGELRRSQVTHYFAKIGDHKNALSFGNTSISEFTFDTLPVADITHFNTFKPFCAKNSIITAAKDKQIVMINEAHENPQHRVFTRTLLSGLYELGYRYLLLEGLSTQKGVPKEYQDTLLAQRKYLLDSPISGLYTTEPQYSNLARNALELGFKVLPYDGSGRNRENEAMQNIRKILKNDFSGKMIIHCGFSHIYEEIDTVYGKTWLAKKIKDSLNIDPLTINQVVLTERPSSQESPFYSMMDFKEPTVFLDLNNEFYNGFSNMNHFDILLYQPRTKYIYNRPHWLLELQNHQLFKVDEEIISFPCLIKAFKESDSTDAVPVDVIEKKAKDDPSYLVLPPGKFRVDIIDKNGLSESYLIEIN